MSKSILVGTVGAPHGVKGQVRVKTFTEDPLALGDYGPLHDEKGRQFDVTDIRLAKTVAVVTFGQITSREAAEALNGTDLFIMRDQLPEELLDEGEFFVEDLLGLRCLDTEGHQIGEVTRVDNHGAGDIIEVRMTLSGKKELFAFDLKTVPEVDLDAGTLTLVPPDEIIVEGEET